MKTLSTLLCLVCLVALGAVVSAALPSSPKARLAHPSRPPANAAKAAAPKPAKASDLPVVGYLERRGRVITIKAGPTGPLYSISTRDGKVLFTDLSDKELRAKAPEVHDFIRAAVAGDRTAGGLNGDARVTIPARKGVVDAGLR